LRSAPSADRSASDTLRSCWPRITPRYGLLRSSAHWNSAPLTDRSVLDTWCSSSSTDCSAFDVSHPVQPTDCSARCIWLSVPVYGLLRTLTLCAPRADHGSLRAQHFEFRTGHGSLHVRHLASRSEHRYLRVPHSLPCVGHGRLRAQHLGASYQARSTPLPTLIAPPRTWITPCTTLGFSVPFADCSALFT